MTGCYGQMGISSLAKMRYSLATLTRKNEMCDQDACIVVKSPSKQAAEPGRKAGFFRVCVSWNMQTWTLEPN